MGGFRGTSPIFREVFSYPVYPPGKKFSTLFNYSDLKHCRFRPYQTSWLRMEMDFRADRVRVNEERCDKECLCSAALVYGYPAF